MPIVAPQYGITPERKRAREQSSPLESRSPQRPLEAAAAAPAEVDADVRPQFWYPKDLPIPGESLQPISTQAEPRPSSRTVTVEVRKRRSIQR
ncbi:hypothetical protein [Candidatus Igneacidithiobacillus taiwanensis]|uniref:hypothetical protein n=1 Tax=Candidatus Igneacidithiobacillus taiwanensis TaxID=1945924 RepID=UPI0028A065D0|nr:hypothetical protein [Candidatus Igneacidithiobacillus taiwanensis]MCE5361447.1 hypothetical protein [Acidithiobacillus sp.]